LPAFRRFASCFYEKCFAVPRIDPFISSHTELHGKSFATLMDYLYIEVDANITRIIF